MLYLIIGVIETLRMLGVKQTLCNWFLVRCLSWIRTEMAEHFYNHLSKWQVMIILIHFRAYLGGQTLSYGEGWRDPACWDRQTVDGQASSGDRRWFSGLFSDTAPHLTTMWWSGRGWMVEVASNTNKQKEEEKKGSSRPMQGKPLQCTLVHKGLK